MAVMKVRVKATAFTKMKQKERLGKEGRGEESEFFSILLPSFLLSSLPPYPPSCLPDPSSYLTCELELEELSDIIEHCPAPHNRLNN
jgi:hypothetical protein